MLAGACVGANNGTKDAADAGGAGNGEAARDALNPEHEAALKTLVARSEDLQLQAAMELQMWPVVEMQPPVLAVLVLLTKSMALCRPPVMMLSPLRKTGPQVVAAA